MLEFRPAEATIVACHGAPAALDALPGDLGCVLRVARDEAWVVGPRDARAELRAAATRALAAADPTGVAVDQTDGWAVCAVRGSGADEVFGRLSVSPLPGERPALVQGALAGVPGKVLFVEGVSYYMVPSPAGHHLRDRLLETCDDLGPSLAEPAPFAGPRGRIATSGVAAGGFRPESAP